MMQRIVSYLLAITAASLVVLTCLSAPLSAHALTTPYLVVGDSLSADAVTSTGTITAWPTLAFGDTVTNNAVPGAQTVHFLNNCNSISCWWLNGVEGVEQLWIMIGHNDISSGRSPAEIIANTETIVDIAVWYGIRDVRLIHAPYTYDIEIAGTFFDRSDRRAALDVLVPLQQTLCQERMEITCAFDLRNVLTLENGGIRYDGVHFTQLGQWVVAGKVQKHLAEIPEPSTALLLLYGVFVLSSHAQKQRRGQM